MRFAYIDSQGNEVPIPGVDALALRIELGAIGPETQLYDAQADRWGPATTHEIYHSLQRESGVEEGFVAPPPPRAPARPKIRAEPEAGSGAPSERSAAPESREAAEARARPATPPADDARPGLEPRPAQRPEAGPPADPALAEGPEAEPVRPPLGESEAGERAVTGQTADDEPSADEPTGGAAESATMDADSPGGGLGEEALPGTVGVEELGLPPTTPAVFDLSGEFELQDESGAVPVEEPAADSDDALDFDFALTEEVAADGGDDGAVLSETADVVDAERADPSADFDLSLVEPETDAALPGASGPAESPELEDEEGFDFGADGALELEPPLLEEPPEDSGPPAVQAGEPDLGGGMELEQPLSGLGFGGDNLDGEGLGMELEQPLSEFSSDAPPSWLDEGEAEAPDLESAADTAAGPRPASPAPPPEEARTAPRTPVARPAPPQRTVTKSRVPLLGGVLAVAVVGAGGWFAFTTLSAGADEEPREPEVVEDPPVRIPEIAAGLMPRMRQIGDLALGDMVAELRSLEGDSGLPAEIRREWLGGHYLANASQYADVQDYWEGIAEIVGAVRERAEATFHEKYVDRMALAGIVGDTAMLLVARADSGFKAAGRDRRETYRLMDDLINASLDLHDFLLDNEENIAYAPAAGGVSRDPVLEAVPSSQGLGNEMWDMVDRITGALQALGTLDRVTTERLLTVLFDRLGEVGFQ